jgi:hypothetical protein
VTSSRRGGERAAKARRKIRELSAKRVQGGDLKPGDQRRSLEAQAVPRRNVTRLLLVGAAFAIGVGVVGASRFQDESPAPQRPALAPAVPSLRRTIEFTSPGRDRELLGENLEARTQRVLERAERGFARFATVLRPRISRIREAWLCTDLELPFHYVSGNHNNPQRNYETVRHLDNGGIEDLRTLPDETYFFYSIMPPSAVQEARFSPAVRLMGLSEDIDPDNDLDMLTFFHELRHVIHDTLRRSRLRTDAERRANLEFYRTPMNVNRPKHLDLLDEATAYAVEIEALNLLLDGELESSVRDHRALDVEAALRRLHARPDQHQRERLLVGVKLAQHFYPQRWTAAKRPPESFLDAVAAAYAGLGYEIYLPSAEGMKLVRSPMTQP